MSDFSADVLKNNLNNPAKNFLWDMIFNNPIGGGDAKTLETRCQTTSIPGRGVGRITIPYKGTAGIVFPGKLNLDHTLSMTFVESSTDKKTWNAINAWQQAIINMRTGLGGPDVAIKTDIYLKCKDQQDNTWLTIKIIGTYPEDMAEVPLSYASQDEIAFRVRWAYDRWEEV